MILKSLYGVRGSSEILLIFLDCSDENVLNHQSLMLSRSLGIVRPNWWINDMVIKGSIKRQACVAAVNENGELLAVRLGVVRDWDLKAWIMDRIQDYPGSQNCERKNYFSSDKASTIHIN